VTEWGWAAVTDRGLRILVVEDERLIRWAVGEALTMNGHTVIGAENAASARRFVKQADEPFDVILLDYRLPDSKDFQLLDDLTRLRPASPVVMMSADADPSLTSAALTHGARRVIDKPFDLAALDSVLREAVAS
jgi:DNA-binding NtrC family response regulator